MSYELTPIAPTQELTINSVRLCAVLSCTFKTVRTPIEVRAVGRSDAVAFAQGAVHHEILITRRLADRLNLDDPIDPFSLHDFVLQVNTLGKRVRYKGCEVISVSAKNEAGIGAVEELLIYAARREEVPQGMR